MDQPTYGERFWNELKRLQRFTPATYATVQRIRRADRDELASILRRELWLGYATVHRLRDADPVEAARAVHAEHERRARAGALLVPLSWLAAALLS